MITKQRQTVLWKGDNVAIPIPAVDRGPTDYINIKGVVTQVNGHGGYKVGTKVGLIKGYSSRNQIDFCESETVNASDVHERELSLRAVASKLSMSGGQGFSIVTVRAVTAKQVGVNAEHLKYCVIQDATSHFPVLINSCLN